MHACVRPRPVSTFSKALEFTENRKEDERGDPLALQVRLHFCLSPKYRTVYLFCDYINFKYNWCTRNFFLTRMSKVQSEWNNIRLQLWAMK